MTDAVYDFAEIAKRLNPKRVGEQKPAVLIEKQPHCQATDPQRCDWPDCPCGQP